MASVLSLFCRGGFKLPSRKSQPSQPIHGIRKHHPPGPPGIQRRWLEGLQPGLWASGVYVTRGGLVSTQLATLSMLVYGTVTPLGLVSLLFRVEPLECTLSMGVDMALPLGTPGRVIRERGDSFICLSWNFCHVCATYSASHKAHNCQVGASRRCPPGPLPPEPPRRPRPMDSPDSGD